MQQLGQNEWDWQSSPTLFLVMNSGTTACWTRNIELSWLIRFTQTRHFPLQMQPKRVRQAWHLLSDLFTRSEFKECSVLDWIDTIYLHVVTRVHAVPDSPCGFCFVRIFSCRQVHERRLAYSQHDLGVSSRGSRKSPTGSTQLSVVVSEKNWLVIRFLTAEDHRRTITVVLSSL